MGEPAYDITQTAMLTILSISRWTASKLDRDVTRNVLNEHNAKEKTGRFTKKVINKDGMKMITDVISRARSYHNTVTLPWGQDGVRILPAKLAQDYFKKMREFKAEFERAVSEFEGTYNDLKDRAREELGTLYDENNYPAINELRDKFAFETSVSPIPNASDFRVELSAEAVDEIKKEIEDRNKNILQNAIRHVWKELANIITHMHDRLTGTDPKNPDKKMVIHNSVVENLKEMIEAIPKLNITNDPELEKMADEIKDKLCAYTPVELRKEPDKRTEVATSAEEILKKMEGYF